MKKILLLILAVAMMLSMAACGSKPETVKNFDELDPSKFHGCINGDGHFLTCTRA